MHQRKRLSEATFHGLLNYVSPRIWNNAIEGMQVAIIIIIKIAFNWMKGFCLTSKFFFSVLKAGKHF